MKNNKKTSVPIYGVSDEGFINKIFSTEMFLVCIAVLLLVIQMSEIKQKTAQRVLCDEVTGHGKALEQVLDSAQNRLSEIKNNYDGNENIDRSDDYIFDRIYSADYDDVFSDAGYDYGNKKNGNKISGNTLNMYAKTEDGKVIVAEISADSLYSLVKSISMGNGPETQYILFDVESGYIPVNTGKSSGFDGLSIGFLNEYEFEKGYSVTKMFKDINEDKTGYTVIESRGEKFSFAYCPISGQGLCLMIFVPEKVLYEKTTGDFWKIYLPTVIVFLSVIVCGVPVLFRTRKTARNMGREALNLRLTQIVLDQIAESSLACIFVYHKSDDSVTVYRDKDGICREGAFYDDGAKFIENHFGHTESDIRKLKNTLAVVGTEKSRKVNLPAKNSDGKEVMLEYTVCAVKKDGERRGDVVCTVVECNGQNQQLTADGFDMVGADDNIYNTTGIEVLLERNQWRFLWNNEECLKKIEKEKNYGTDYDKAVEYNIAPHVMSADRQLFLKALSRLQLLENYRNGVTDSCVKYRLNIGSGVYEYRVLDVHMYRDRKNDEIKANLYARHLGKA